jgi:hypothetical protein
MNKYTDALALPLHVCYPKTNIKSFLTVPCNATFKSPFFPPCSLLRKKRMNKLTNIIIVKWHEWAKSERRYRCTTMIQKLYRGYISRKKCKEIAEKVVRQQAAIIRMVRLVAFRIGEGRGEKEGFGRNK